MPYVDIIYEGDKIPLPMLPPLGDFASEDEVSCLTNIFSPISYISLILLYHFLRGRLMRGLLCCQRGILLVTRLNYSSFQILCGFFCLFLKSPKAINFYELFGENLCNYLYIF